MNSLFKIIIDWFYKKNSFILFIWLVLIILSILNLNFNKSNNFEMDLTGARGTEAAKVEQILAKDFDFLIGSSAAIVIMGQVDTKDLQSDLKNNFPKAISEIINIEKGKHENQLLFLKFSPKFGIVKAQGITKDIRSTIKLWSDKNNVKTYLTGSTAFHQDTKESVQKDSMQGELLALSISFMVLVFSFGALVSAFLPLLTGISTLVFLHSIIRLFGLPVNVVSVIITSLIGLALAIDYSLFIVSRYQEELKDGKGSQKALNNTLFYAGRTILFSSLIMLCSVSVLAFPDVSLLRTIVFNILMVIFISMFNSLVFLPCFLVKFESILDKPKFMSRFINKFDRYLFWKKFATHIVSYPKSYFTLSVFLLLLISYPLLSIKLWAPVHTVAPKNSESINGYHILEKDNWGGKLVPINLIVKTGKNGNVFDKKFLEYIYDLTEEIKKNPKVASVQSLTSWNDSFKKDDYINFYHSMIKLGMPLNQFDLLINKKSGSNLTLINVYQKDLMNLHETKDIIKSIGNSEISNSNYEVLKGGIVARLDDYTVEIYSYLPEMLSIIFIGIYILLFFYMKAFILPLKAAFMNFLPILSSFGLIVLIFQYGFLHNLLDTPINGAVTDIVPVVLFCVVFGLSMDYEVLILSRITEVYEETNSVKESVIEGLAKSGSLITGAALILLAVFLPGVFSSSSQTQELCIGITFAIFIDATIVRLLMVPSFMVLMGKWNWWNPLIKK